MTVRELADIRRTRREVNSFLYATATLTAVLIFIIGFTALRGGGNINFYLLSLFAFVILFNFFLYLLMRRERLTVYENKIVYQSMFGRAILLDTRDVNIVDIEKEQSFPNQLHGYQIVFLDENGDSLLKVSVKFLKTERRKILFEVLRELGINVKG